MNISAINQSQSSFKKQNSSSITFKAKYSKAFEEIIGTELGKEFMGIIKALESRPDGLLMDARRYGDSTVIVKTSIPSLYVRNPFVEDSIGKRDGFFFKRRLIKAILRRLMPEETNVANVRRPIETEIGSHGWIHTQS